MDELEWETISKLPDVRAARFGEGYLVRTNGIVGDTVSVSMIYVPDAVAFPKPGEWLAEAQRRVDGLTG